MPEENLVHETPTMKQEEAGLWKERGDAFFKQGDYENALACYNSGLEIDSDNCKIWNNKGFCLHKIGRKEEAGQCRQKILDIQDSLNLIKKALIEEKLLIKEEKPVPVVQVAHPERPLPPEGDINESKEGMNRAKISGISGSTRQLLRGNQTSYGRQLTGYKEINHFFHHYDEILSATELDARKKQDIRLYELDSEEVRLDGLLREGIAKQTIEVDKNLNNLKNKATTSGNIFRKFGYRLQYSFGKHLRTRRINGPFSEMSKDLLKVRDRKENLLLYKEQNVRNECNRVDDYYQYLKQNESFLIGAYGEELVIKILSQLSGEYHVFNDVNLHFHHAIRWKGNDFIKSSQIDHVVIGPAGIFLIETKNWKVSDIIDKSEDLVFQVKRSNFALWKFLIRRCRRSEMVKIRNVVVATHGSGSLQSLDKYVDIIPPGQLISYITRRKEFLSEADVEELAEIIPVN